MMELEHKKELRKIIISAICFFIIYFTNLYFDKSQPNFSPITYYLVLVLFLCSYFVTYLYIGKNCLKKTATKFKKKKIFTEQFLMTIASLGAFLLSIYNLVCFNNIDGAEEGLAVMILYSLGEWFEDFATDKGKNSILKMNELKNEYAIVRKDNAEIKTKITEIPINSKVIVCPGDAIPLDGVVINGDTYLDTKALTGESKPKYVQNGDTVLAGCINLNKEIIIKTTKIEEETVQAKILRLIQEAGDKKTKTENFISKFAKYYTKVVVILAVLIFILPVLLNLIMSKDTNLSVWIYRALSFLVVSCPCSIIISVPLCFFLGVCTASKNGIIIKGSVFLELLDKADLFAFDKTGTLTKGEFKVTSIEPQHKKDEIIYKANIAEKNIIHPIANSIKNIGTQYEGDEWQSSNIQGKGIIAQNEKGEKIYCGSSVLMKDNNINHPTLSNANVIYVADSSGYLGYMIIEDEIKNESGKVIKELSKKSKIVMLTGDDKDVAKDVCDKLNIDSFCSNLLPDDKINELKKLKQNFNTCVFVGDGLNDAGVLACCDAGIAMGGLAATGAIEQSDIIINDDNLEKILVAKKIAHKAVIIAKENITLSLVAKILIMVLIALGHSSMWLASFGDVGIMLIAVLNSLRIQKLAFKTSK